MGFIKKLLIFVLVLAVIGAGITWLFRNEIVKYSAEKVIRAGLPDYIRVDKITVDPKNGEFTAEGLAVLNPSGFHNRYMATVDKVGCRFRGKEDNILNGIKITDVSATEPHINIERLADGRVNLKEFQKMVSPGESPSPESAADKGTAGGSMPGAGLIKREDLTDRVEFPENIGISNGKITFIDKKISQQGYVLSFENVNGDVTISMSKDNTFVRKIGSEGRGNVNGDTQQTINWRIFWEPVSSRLTLSSRFRVQMVDIMPFKPYYDRYSPVNVHKGWMSGTLVFDFDNGNIGSTNEIRLYRFEFTKRSRGSASKFWNVAVSDVVEYLRTAHDEITFDFKIKGDMDSPTIYPGPYVKKAIRMLALDTIDQLVSGSGKKEGDAAEGTAGGGTSPPEDRSDAEKVVDIIRELMKSRQ